MQRSMFQVLFYVKRQSEKHGQVPVMGRITINGTKSQFCSKLIVRTSLWDTKANKASGKSLESQRINEKLENIKISNYCSFSIYNLRNGLKQVWRMVTLKGYFRKTCSLHLLHRSFRNREHLVVFAKGKRWKRK